jgi:hypothetical protein
MLPNKMTWGLAFGMALLTGFIVPARGQNHPGGDTVANPYPQGDKGDIWLLGGQSNMKRADAGGGQA